MHVEILDNEPSPPVVADMKDGDVAVILSVPECTSGADLRQRLVMRYGNELVVIGREYEQSYDRLFDGEVSWADKCHIRHIDVGDSIKFLP